MRSHDVGSRFRVPEAIALVLLSAIAAPGPLAAQEVLAPLLGDAELLVDARLRYEFVDQEGFERNASALTLRSRLGVQTGSLRGFSGLIEGDFTRDLGVSGFNSTTNGKVDFPVIADPNSQRLNRFHLGYRHPDGSSLTLGRQRIIHDDARFVGNVGFRQNEQTFDAVRLDLVPTADVTLHYSHVWQVNRILGSRSPGGEVGAAAHLLRASYRLPFGSLTGFAYRVGLDAPLAAASNQTYGARLSVERPIREGVGITSAVAFATQRAHAGNPTSFSLDYRRLEAGGHWDRLNGSAAVETLEGDGARGFTTPLATLHAFQGYADVFLETPGDGIRDASVAVGYRMDWAPRPVRVTARYHDFATQRSSRKLGREIDVGLFVTVGEHTGLVVEYADFAGTDPLPGATKLWVALNLSR